MLLEETNFGQKRLLVAKWKEVTFVLFSIILYQEGILPLTGHFVTIVTRALSLQLWVGDPLFWWLVSTTGYLAGGIKSYHQLTLRSNFGWG